MDPATVSIHVLGPLSASLEGRAVTPSAAKQRQVLALLALNSGRAVTISTLIEEIWGCRPPLTATAIIQTYIFHLRSRLAGDLPRELITSKVLQTAHTGYQLECQTDVWEFHQLTRAGREATDPRTVSRLLGRALALWRGPALTDVRQGRILETEAASLEETRLVSLERRIQADLTLGRQSDLLSELTKLVAQHPLNENFYGLLMTALYRAGHVARALEVFQRLRAVLGNDLGVDPNPRLQRLQRAILSGDPSDDLVIFLREGQELTDRR